MTRLLELPVRTTRMDCPDCKGMGYTARGGCRSCGGRGSLVVDLVVCPEHGRIVARHQEGGLLGVCDGCAAEAARALSILTSNATGRAGALRQDRAGAAKEATA